jgi:hypothetical protein
MPQFFLCRHQSWSASGNVFDFIHASFDALRVAGARVCPSFKQRTHRIRIERRGNRSAKKRSSETPEISGDLSCRSVWHRY